MMGSTAPEAKNLPSLAGQSGRNDRRSAAMVSRPPTGAEANPKSGPELAQQLVQIDACLVLTLHEFHEQVNVYIKGYLALDELHDALVDARQSAEGGGAAADFFERLRREATEICSERFYAVPPSLRDQVPSFETALDDLNLLFDSDASPLMSPDANVAAFVTEVRRRLSAPIRDINRLRSLCRQMGLESLEQTTRYVERILTRTEDARQSAAEQRPVTAWNRADVNRTSDFNLSDAAAPGSVGRAQ